MYTCTITRPLKLPLDVGLKQSRGPPQIATLPTKQPTLHLISCAWRLHTYTPWIEWIRLRERGWNWGTTMNTYTSANTHTHITRCKHAHTHNSSPRVGVQGVLWGLTFLYIWQFLPPWLRASAKFVLDPWSSTQPCPWDLQCGTNLNIHGESAKTALKPCLVCRK